ncbi:hypothetical protein [Achromobacter xylosoxidans]|uniref:hypothetical protein n=1 Tax=Alcaligenes xylosoxydans xylosoxydans TaxID=85698 RepID=UPI001D107039
MPGMQPAQPVPQDLQVAGLPRGQLHFQRDVVARRLAAGLPRLVLPASLLAPRMRLGQAPVLRHQPGRHIARREHVDARADVLLQQAHDDAQAPPGEVRQRLVDLGARNLRVQLRLHRLVHRPPGGHGVMRLALQARQQRPEQHGRLGLRLEQRGGIQAPRGDARAHRVAAVLSPRAPTLDPILVAHRHATG